MTEQTLIPLIEGDDGTYYAVEPDADLNDLSVIGVLKASGEELPDPGGTAAEFRTNVVKTSGLARWFDTPL